MKNKKDGFVEVKFVKSQCRTILYFTKRRTYWQRASFTKSTSCLSVSLVFRC